MVDKGKVRHQSNKFMLVFGVK